MVAKAVERLKEAILEKAGKAGRDLRGTSLCTLACSFLHTLPASLPSLLVPFIIAPFCLPRTCPSIISQESYESLFHSV
jgi:hypothetical protein